jgi:hypothetical protein
MPLDLPNDIRIHSTPHPAPSTLPRSPAQASQGVVIKDGVVTIGDSIQKIKTGQDTAGNIG